MGPTSKGREGKGWDREGIGRGKRESERGNEGRERERGKGREENNQNCCQQKLYLKGCKKYFTL